MKPAALQILGSVILAFACGCAVGPNYRKPKANVPTIYRGVTPEEAAQGETRSLAEEKWWDVFRDEQLRELIKTALQQNYDVRIAAARILQAQAQLGVTRADQFPAIAGSAGAINERSPRSKFLPPFETSANQVGASLAWDLDFWGKYRRATEAARANLMATEWARREILTDLVANVASAYFQLRALDLQLEISQRTLASRRDSLRLTNLWPRAAPRPCSTFAKRNSWFLPQLPKSLVSNNRSSRRKTLSVLSSATTLHLFPEDEN